MIIAHDVINAQYCIDGRFTQDDYFSSSEIVIQNNISYGLADQWFAGIVQPDLNYFNIAYPDPAVDPLEKKPLIVLAHGGGFWGGEKEELDTMIQSLAQRGFIAVSTNYRKGWATDGTDDCSGDGESLAEAIYKSMQDINACVRYLVANADYYQIDTANIFLGGESAGAFSAMNSYYISQSEWNNIWPDDMYTYGQLNNSTNDYNVTFTVKGFINMWGGLMDTNLIGSPEMKPTISFYGMTDDVVPPTEGYFLDCVNYTHLFGSVTVDHLMEENGICHALHARPGTGHIAYPQLYTAGNAACFFKSLFCDQCTSYYANYQEAECSDLQLNTTSVYSNINDQARMYPNPAADYVVIAVTGQLEYNSALRITNATGANIQTPYVQNGNSFTVDLSGLPSGVYFVSVKNGSELKTGSFIKN